MDRVKRFFAKYYTEIVPALFVVLGLIVATASSLKGITAASVAEVASLSLQTAATFVSLQLAAYTVFSALRLNSPFKSEFQKLSIEDKQLINKYVDQISQTFLQNIWRGTVSIALCFAIFVTGKLSLPGISLLRGHETGLNVVALSVGFATLLLTSLGAVASIKIIMKLSSL